MKFAGFLIKAFCGLLAVGLLGGFIFYAFQYQQTSNPATLTLAHVSLVLFLMSTVVLSLVFIMFDVAQSRNVTGKMLEALQQYAATNQGETAAPVEANKESLELLQNISAITAETNKVLSTQFETLNNYMESRNNSSIQNAEQMGAAITQLNNVCETISAQVTNIKGKKEKEVDHTGDFAVLIRTMAQLSSDLNDLNGRILTALNHIGGDVSKLTNNHDDISNNIKAVTQNLLSNSDLGLQNELETVNEPEVPYDAEYDEPSGEQISVADYYEQAYGNVENPNGEPVKPLWEPEPDDMEGTETLSENDYALPETTTPETENEQPAAWEYAEETTPISLDLTNEQTYDEPATYAEDAPLTEETIPDDTVVTEINTDTPIAEFTTDFGNEDNAPAYLETETADTQSLETAVPEETVALEETVITETVMPEEIVMPEETAALEEATPTDLSAVNTSSLTADNPFGTPTTNPTPINTSEDNAINLNDTFDINSLGADDPFGANSEPESITEDNAFNENTPEDKLNSIFNEDFANEIADLDILKDDNVVSEEAVTNETDLENLLK